MDCACCGVPVGGDKKYVLYALIGQTKQVCLCKGCLVRGSMRAASGSIVTRDDILQAPRLAFPFRQQEPNRAEFCKVAREQGWLTHGVSSECVVIEEHYSQALMNNYFNGEGWTKKVSKTPLECFKSSCANIRDCYPQWLELRAGK